MKIWYVISFATDVEGEANRHLFPSKAAATKYYNSLLRDAKELLKEEYEENDGIFEHSGEPKPKRWLDKEWVSLEARASEPSYILIPSRPTKAQIIQAFDNF
jgi:hypothetical protein